MNLTARDIFGLGLAGSVAAVLVWYLLVLTFGGL